LKVGFTEFDYASERPGRGKRGDHGLGQDTGNEVLRRIKKFMSMGGLPASSEWDSTQLTVGGKRDKTLGKIIKESKEAVFTQE